MILLVLSAVVDSVLPRVNLPYYQSQHTHAILIPTLDNKCLTRLSVITTHVRARAYRTSPHHHHHHWLFEEGTAGAAATSSADDAFSPPVSLAFVAAAAAAAAACSSSQWPLVASLAAMMSGVRLASGRASFRKGCLSSSKAVARWSTSTSRH